MHNLLQNHFERDTEILGRPLVREEVLFIYKIAACFNTYSYQKAFELIKSYQQFVKKHQIRQEDDSFLLEVDFMQAFCLYNLKNIQEAQSICKNILQTIEKRTRLTLTQKQISEPSQSSELMLQSILALKVYTFIIVIMVQGHKVTINPKNCLQWLVNALRPNEMRRYLPQVLGTLTGCKSFTSLRTLHKLGGQNSQKKAKKLQILASWKYLIGQNDDCLRFKRQACEIWQSQNCLAQTKNSQQELSQLLGKTKGQYIQRLKRLKYFVSELVPFQLDQKEVNKQTLVKWCFPSLIEEIKLVQEDAGKSKIKTSALKSSKSQSNESKQRLRFINQQVINFFQIYKKQCNGQVSNLIFNSRFMSEQINKVRGSIKILSMLRSQRLKYFLNAFKAYCNQLIALEKISSKKK